MVRKQFLGETIALALLLALLGGCEKAPSSQSSSVGSPTPTTASRIAKDTSPLTGTLSIAINPPVLELPAGSSGQYRVTVQSECCPSWSTGDLPPGMSVEFLQSAIPMDKVLQIDTPGTMSSGEHSFFVGAIIDSTLTGSAQARLQVLPCQEFEPGTSTLSLEDDLINVITAGKPDYARGGLVPLQVCDSPAPRVLKVTVTSATSEAGTPMAKAPRFYLFHSLVWPAPERIDSHTLWHNVDQEQTFNVDWTLERKVSPGLYLLVFEHDQYADMLDPKEANTIPRSVTYRVEMVDAPPQP